MKISEYTLLRDAFENSFGFMLNRIEEYASVSIPREDVEAAEERCWSEFMVAIEEMGIELGDLTTKPWKS